MRYKTKNKVCIKIGWKFKTSIYNSVLKEFFIIENIHAWLLEALQS